MRAHSRPVRSTRPNGRRLAGAVLAAAALLAAAGCSGDTKAAPPQTGKAVADVSSTIAGLKVCELTSLTPLVKVLGSPGYKDGPADVQADASFASRVKEVEGFGGTAKVLPGTWTTGKVVAAEGDTEDAVLVLVQQDTYLSMIYLQVTGDTSYREKVRFTTAQVASTS